MTVEREVLEDLYYADFSDQNREWSSHWSQGKRVFVIADQRVHVEHTVSCRRMVIEEGWGERDIFFIDGGPNKLPVVTASALFDTEECRSPVTGNRLYCHVAEDGANWDRITKIEWHRYTFGRLLGIVPEMTDMEAVEWAYVRSSSSYLAVLSAYQSLWRGQATHAVWKAFMEAQKRVFPRGHWETPQEPAQTAPFKMPTVTLYQDLAGFAAMDLNGQIEVLTKIFFEANSAKTYNWDNVSLSIAIEDVSIMIAQRKVFQLFGLMPTVNPLISAPGNLSQINEWLTANARRIANSGTLDEKQRAANLWFEAMTGGKIIYAVTDL